MFNKVCLETLKQKRKKQKKHCEDDYQKENKLETRAKIFSCQNKSRKKVYLNCDAKYFFGSILSGCRNSFMIFLSISIFSVSMPVKLPKLVRAASHHMYLSRCFLNGQDRFIITKKMSGRTRTHAYAEDLHTLYQLSHPDIYIKFKM